MQMVMMVFRTSLEHSVLPLVEQEGLPYTRLDTLQGKGVTGRVPDRITSGGSNLAFLIAMPDERLSPFQKRATEIYEELTALHKGVGPPFHIFVLPCVQLF
jgi:hypothetical protein